MIYIKSWRTWMFLVYIFTVIYFSSQQTHNISWFSQLWKYDKIIHLIEYFGVGFLLVNAIKIKPMTKIVWKYALLFLFIFPILDELIQFFTPTRIPDVYDAIVDIIGGTLGAYLRRYI